MGISYQEPSIIQDNISFSTHPAIKFDLICIAHIACQSILPSEALAPCPFINRR